MERMTLNDIIAIARVDISFEARNLPLLDRYWCGKDGTCDHSYKKCENLYVLQYTCKCVKLCDVCEAAYMYH